MPSGILWLDASVLGLLGLLIGSFLNVVIHRLPRMLERQWAAECAELAGQPAAGGEPFNLTVPRSRCPHCGHGIRWHENIPVLSYLLLRGRCSHCHGAIGLRYPAVELLTGALFYACAWRWGASPSALAWSAFSAMLLALALIEVGRFRQARSVLGAAVPGPAAEEEQARRGGVRVLVAARLFLFGRPGGEERVRVGAGL